MENLKRDKNGNWTTRVYIGRGKDGKKHYKRFTRATKAECRDVAGVYEASFKKNAVLEPNDRTIGDVVDEYIDMCREVCSITTIQGYDKIRRTAFPTLWDVKIADFNKKDAQAAINKESKRVGRRGKISAKTVANNWGLVSSALHYICGITVDIKLPREKRNIKEFPDPLDVMRAIEGTTIELPCMLALWLSLSLSEVRGLQYSDIRNGSIFIDRTVVDTKDGPVVKNLGKAECRIRRLQVPAFIQDMIDASDHISEFIVPLNSNQIRGRFGTICKKNGLDLTFHDLRHLNASVMLMLNVPEKYAMERGGWKTSHVMQTVYQHTLSDGRIAVDQKIDDYFCNLLEQRSALSACEKKDGEQ